MTQARDIREKLAKANPGVAKYQSGLAGTRLSMGVLLIRAGRDSEALESFKEASGILEKLVKDHPGVPAYRSDLAGTPAVVQEFVFGRLTPHHAN